jgi:threonyl-tRNA synthetase
MLTRIYGLAFLTQKDLDAYLLQQEEAKKRDHKKLGVELDLFTFSDLVGSGLPLWTPKGTLVRNLLDTYVWELRQEKGYERVEIPHITKKDLYITSGHWDKYKDDLFRITTREGHEFAMKPMNCPHHTQIYARKMWSYRELPQRYANTTTCYRDEQSGELSGLSRVRAFAQDDAHVFCRMAQAKEEFLKIWDIVEKFYNTFGFNLRVRISKHDPEHPEKYLGDKERWAFAENMLTEIAEGKKVETFDGIGEAAFYGPKLDFMANDAIGREWQVATIQLDMNMPERFDLTCTNEKGEKERIVMIHAAIMGSIERFLSILIEHTAGVFPTWLSPIQVSVVPIKDTHEDKADEVVTVLRNNFIRGEKVSGNDSLGKRIHQAKAYNTPYVIVIGDKEKDSGNLTIEKRDGSKDTKTLEEFLEYIKNEIKNRA